MDDSDEVEDAAAAECFSCSKPLVNTPIVISLN